jgi:putative sterol carrier protein
MLLSRPLAGWPTRNNSMTLDELFEIMKDKAGKVSLAAPVTASILLNIAGDVPRSWLVAINGTAVAVHDSPPAGNPDLEVSTSEDVLLKVAGKELSPMAAFFTGKIKVKGDTGLISHLKSLWPES